MTLEEQMKKAIRNIPDFPKKGIVFKDITPLMLRPQLSKEITAALVQQAKSLGVQAICGLDSRGFLFGNLIAQNLGLPFILIRKKGKLPGETYAASYDLEYGTATLEIHKTDIPKGGKVLIHDDLLATGGTAKAAGSLVQQAGGIVAGYSFLIHLSFLDGASAIKPFSENIHALVTY